MLRAGNGVELLASTSGTTARFHLRVEDGGTCAFGYATGNDFRELPQPYQAKKGMWIGAKVDPYSVKDDESSSSGHADFDYFRLNGKNIAEWAEHQTG